MPSRSLLAVALLLAVAQSGVAKDLEGERRGRPPAQAEPAAPAATGLQVKLAEIRRLALAEDEAGAYAMIATLVDEPDFGTLAEPARLEVHAAAGSLAWQRQDHAVALHHFTRATELSGSRESDWTSRAWLALIEEDRDGAAAALAERVRRWPATAPDIDAQLLHGALDADFGSDARYALMQALFAADYAPRLSGDASAIWRLLAEQQIARGNPDAARASVARITTPASLVRVLADRRYDALVDRGSPQFDLGRAAIAHVADLRARAILDPDKLEIQAELIAAMTVAGQHEDAVALAEEIAAAVGSAPDGAPPYSDLAEHLPWVLNNGSIALVRAGRTEHALRMLQQAAALSEDGEANISQTLNLGQLYNHLGRHDDALATVATVADRMSTIGRMVQANARLRAALRTGDAATAAAALAFLRENRASSAAIYLESLVEAGELDEAARLVIEMLDSPEDRSDALESMQDYPQRPDLPGEKRYREARRRLEARADVQAAVARAGRVLPRLPVHSAY